MNIIVDIGHPAHVHFFKNFIWEMKSRGHEILITATRKDVALELLHNYGFDYIAMGSYGNSSARKMINIPIMDFKMLRVVGSFKPDIFIGISTIRAAHASQLMREPCIVFDDTEHSKWEHFLYLPGASVVCTPSCFKKDLGKKQVRYNGYHELAYLHPNYFKPDPSVLSELGLNESDRFIIVRFVAWKAGHDIGQHGFGTDTKRRLVAELEEHARVFITSENPLPEDFQKYRITLPPERMHDLLYYAIMYIGEGATMATEAAILGTPSIYVSSLCNTMGNLVELEQRFGLVHSFKESEPAIRRATELLQQPKIRQDWAEKRQKLLADKIDVTHFMVEFVEGYPESFRKVRRTEGDKKCTQL